ncbi:hypothetical protein BDA96_03G159500 [Sorghum bicolor]|uniref:FAM192A/Fyv6 N-terminal domain-containing protein n=2 Tax=Sorghum bicolor TaxID=4558 RepID=A0A921UNH4_SORBI|nr:protein FAM192A isoform X1 [Sorghum bicolor]EES00678.1 hypothetical protein SORBI_3003G151000 [Sorghum bicolor]KAG0537565.1 hypothetical protein BDA96_03G159500 [Sorghum bicolor]|eukprot:XP_002455558.1 protein FAM192A isoform X1 [Sorghum bicolor]
MAGNEMTPSSKAAAPPATIRLVNFISEDQLDEVKRTRGERVEDGTAQRDKPLFQILQENKEKKDAEFNERFKHRPPKALDEDETEFLDKLASSRKEYEQQVANEEAEQLRSFHEAVAARSSIVHELETPTVSRPEESRPKPPTKRSQHALLKNVIISVKPQAKKPKVEAEAKPAPAPEERPSNGHDADQKQPDDTKATLGSLVAYDDDESGEDDD